MMERFKSYHCAIILVALLTSFLDAPICSAQPDSKSSTDESADSSSSEQSGVGQSGSGVAYPQKSEPGRTYKVRNEFDSGTPTPTELEAMSRIKLQNESSPRQAIKNFVDKLPPTTGPASLSRARLQLVEDAALSVAFNDYLVYTLTFPQWPIAFALPEPLQNNNLFVFDKTGKFVFVKSSDELEKLFRERASKVKDDQSARSATIAYLVLSEALAQDGMYQFTINDSNIKITRGDTGITTSGKAEVKPVGGNAGEITVKLMFDQSGELLSADHKVNLQTGMRPICQSTKLLDPDPIVRRMAEQDLLIMGRAAKPYLDEQREKVSPKLRVAIDEIWQRIELESR